MKNYCPYLACGAGTDFTTGASTFGATGATAFTSHAGLSSWQLEHVGVVADKSEVDTTAINIEDANFIKSPLTTLKFSQEQVVLYEENFIQEQFEFQEACLVK